MDLWGEGNSGAGSQAGTVRGAGPVAQVCRGEKMPTCSARDPGRQPFRKDGNHDDEAKLLKMRFLPT